VFTLEEASSPEIGISPRLAAYLIAISQIVAALT
jgi:hypothetical protein